MLGILIGADEPHQPGAPAEDVPRELGTAILSRLEGRETHELDEIDAAQARLAAGTFGGGCARPTARLCVAGQSREEARG